MMRILDGEVQFPAERAHEIHAQQVHIGGQSHFGDLSGQPGEGGVVEGRVGELRQHLPGARPGQDEHAAAAGDVAQADAAVLGQLLLQIVAVVALGGAGADDVEVLIGDLGDGELAADSAAAGQRMA